MKIAKRRVERLAAFFTLFSYCGKYCCPSAELHLHYKKRGYGNNKIFRYDICNRGASRRNDSYAPNEWRDIVCRRIAKCAPSGRRNVRTCHDKSPEWVAGLAAQSHSDAVGIERGVAYGLSRSGLKNASMSRACSRAHAAAPSG